MKDFDSFKKITTEDCVKAICELLYYQGKKGDNLNPKNWKRLSKSGTDIIIRSFTNKVTGQKLIVSEKDGRIFKIEDGSTVSANDLKSAPEDIFSDLKGSALFPNKPDDDLSKDFPFVYVFDFATVYSKSKIAGWEFKDESEEIEDSDYIDCELCKGTRIGVLNYEESDIETLIVITSDTVFYSNDGSMTNDGISYFELSKNIHYVPAQEPVDLLETNFENGGGCKIENADKMKLVAKKYKLNHFLISA